MDLKEELNKIAAILAKKAIQNDTPLAESIDAFKELRAYYALTLKETKPDENDGGLSFDGFQRRVQAAEQADGKVRTRQRQPS